MTLIEPCVVIGHANATVCIKQRLRDFLAPVQESPWRPLTTFGMDKPAEATKRSSQAARICCRGRGPVGPEWSSYGGGVH